MCSLCPQMVEILEIKMFCKICGNKLKHCDCIELYKGDKMADYDKETADKDDYGNVTAKDQKGVTLEELENEEIQQKSD